MGDFFLVTLGLDELSSYLATVHSLLDDEWKRFGERFDALAQGLADEEEQNLISFYYDDIARLRDDFPRRLYSSFVVSWYSFAEDQLLAVCDRLERKRTTPVPVEYRHRKYIHHAYDFLARVVGYKINSKDWGELKRIRRVRNSIAHSAGRLRYACEKPARGRTRKPVMVDDVPLYLCVSAGFQRYLEDHSLLKFSTTHFVIDPSVGYCEYLTAFGGRFFARICLDQGLVSRFAEPRARDLLGT
jgi:hypothetical protein